MLDRTTAIWLVEDALDRQPFCPACSSPTTIHEEDGRLFVECPAVHPDGGVAARLIAAIVGHLHQPIRDFDMPLAA